MNQKVTTNQLARMIAKGFNDMQKQFNQKIDHVHHDLSQKIDQANQEILNIKMDMNDFQVTKANYVSKFEYKRLVQRVDVLEDKI